MTITTNYSFLYNGKAFGGTGSPYQITSIDGLEGLPQIRNQDDNRGYQDGMFTGADFLSGRTIVITFQTLASSGHSAQDNFNLIQQALIPTFLGTLPLYFLLSNAGAEQYINARVRALRTPVTPDYTYGLITSQVEFFCPEGIYYNSTLKSGSLSVSAAPGRTYNRIYPLVYGYGSLSTSTAVLNSGWANAYPTITITGPIKNIVCGNVTTNKLLRFTGTITSTDTLVIDTYNKLVTLNGLPARNLLLGTSEWFNAPAGTSQYYLTGTNSTAGLTAATVTWHDTYV
jgi:hypothetical protein